MESLWCAAQGTYEERVKDRKRCVSRLQGSESKAAEKTGPFLEFRSITTLFSLALISSY